MAKALRESEIEFAKKTKKIHDDAETRDTEDLEAFVAKLKPAGRRPPTGS